MSKLTLEQAREQLHFNQKKVRIIEYLYLMGRTLYPSVNSKALTECILDLPHTFVDFSEIYQSLILVPKINGTTEDGVRTWLFRRIKTVLPLIAAFHLRHVENKSAPKIMFVYRTGTCLTGDILTKYIEAMNCVCPDSQIDEYKQYTSYPNQNFFHLSDGTVFSNRSVMLDNSQYNDTEVLADGFDLVFIDENCIGTKIIGCKNVVRFAGLDYSV